LVLEIIDESKEGPLIDDVRERANYMDIK